MGRLSKLVHPDAPASQRRCPRQDRQRLVLRGAQRDPRLRRRLVAEVRRAVGQRAVGQVGKRHSRREHERGPHQRPPLLLQQPRHVREAARPLEARHHLPRPARQRQDHHHQGHDAHAAIPGPLRPDPLRPQPRLVERAVGRHLADFQQGPRICALLPRPRGH
ncbi:hypothetical protein BN1708_018771 [Verticillium longisporum]|uniref:Uncharacterized protein n=1 Tax=Verticillium longisporum TaxID=100787 RepID=A0A0G4MBP8_VERLO|nr:hypothetical protein BN1708_018771 [Verticillium longisporum]